MPVPRSDVDAGGPGRASVVRLWSLVAAFVLVTLVRSLQTGIPLRDPNGAILARRVLLTLGIFVVLLAVDAVRRAPAGSRTRARAVLLTLRHRWGARRLLLAAGALGAYHVVYFCYHNLKSWDVLNRPRDRLLLGWDRWLFLGHSPAVLLHDLLGQGVATYVLVGVYESFSTLVSVSFVAAVVLPDRIRDGYAFITSFVCVWILGVASYYAIPSLGPFHSAPGEFAGLPHTLVQDTQTLYLAQRTRLLADPSAHDAFAQVSAFASLHVGVTTVIVLMAWRLGLRRLAAVLTVFLCGTIVATVYLGWHFFVDDLVGLGIALVSVAAALRIVPLDGTWPRVFRPARSDGPPAGGRGRRERPR
ncbi:phosphatase PAP2 family protein [Nocardioides panacis]|uniref:phosphatase PAP2 family protein n=1 Tax=Nocardioides panacis TaxID=2849501 RepID=UPI0020B3ED95|nr:phosphatase PAP2 family protein [Nocardioides panacis]